MKVALFLALAFASLAPASADAAQDKVTPVQKVIELLQGMLEKGKAERHDEQVQFAAYKQFCDDTKTETERDIAEANEMIEKLKADIQKYEADAAQLAKEIAEHEEDIAVWTGDIKAATKVRGIEKADYDATHKDYTESVEALQMAHAADIGARVSRHNDAVAHLKQVNEEAMLELKQGWQRAVKIVRTELDDCEVRHATAEARVRDLEQERREMERQVAELKRAVEHEKLEAGMAANVAATDVSAMALRLKTAEDALTDAQEARLAVVKQAAALETTVADMEAKRKEMESRIAALQAQVRGT